MRINRKNYRLCDAMQVFPHLYGIILFVTKNHHEATRCTRKCQLHNEPWYSTRQDVSGQSYFQDHGICQWLVSCRRNSQISSIPNNPFYFHASSLVPYVLSIPVLILLFSSNLSTTLKFPLRLHCEVSSTFFTTS